MTKTLRLSFVSYLLIPISCFLLLSGCAGKKIKIDPSNPVYGPKNDFERDYGFFITPDEKKNGYAAGFCLGLARPETIQPFNEIDTLAEFRKFEKCFWDIRDTNTQTSQNEFKVLIDGRLKDIENEIFASDIDIPGTRFQGPSGGLKGDLAHVYLLWGAPAPGNKAKLNKGSYHTELTVWYYFFNNRVLFSFLFYNDHGRVRLFKEYGALFGLDLFDPLASPLRLIGNRPANTREEMMEIWNELEYNDPEEIFRNALFRFSSYKDWVVENGNGKDKFGAIDPPIPIMLAAKRFRPTILGQPNIPEGTELFENGYHSFIPVDLQIAADPIGGRPSFSFTVAYADLDWEVKDKTAEAVLNVRISFQNKKTRALDEFETRVVFKGPRQAVESLIRGKNPKTGEPNSRTVDLNGMMNFAAGKDQATLRQLIDGFEQSEYVVNIYFQHTLTKKYNTWREEIEIKK
ncbi:MAG: hypothetical protein HYX22_02325 [Candidatus Yanofskybacteria bacterium]|nr:hypothetical protein [Candidatus Yanofskybacteria bacterium]